MSTQMIDASRDCEYILLQTGDSYAHVARSDEYSCCNTLHAAMI